MLAVAACDLTYRPFAATDNPASTHFTNSARYNLALGREGTDLLPELSTIISRAGKLNATEPASAFIASPSGRLQIGLCTGPPIKPAYADADADADATTFAWRTTR
eukprot:3300975-Prymnesium_polylepis.1